MVKQLEVQERYFEISEWFQAPSRVNMDHKYRDVSEKQKISFSSDQKRILAKSET